MELFEAFPNVGMVTGRPLRTPEVFSSSTLEWGRKQPDGVLEEGKFIDWDTLWEHAISTGVEYKKAQNIFNSGKDYRLTYNGKQAYIGAGHFQFMARKDVLQKIIPLPSKEPMRGERILDIMINKFGFLRMTTNESYVRHIGNRLPEAISPVIAMPKPNRWIKRLIWLPGLRHILLWLHNQIFRLYFINIK